MRLHPRLGLACTGALALSGLCGCLADSRSTPEVDCERIPSLRHTWKKASATNDEKGRRTVAAYIVDCGALRGQPRRKVRHVLGRPVEADHDEMLFYLGEDGLKIDSENLVIYFDDRGRAITAEIAQG